MPDTPSSSRSGPRARAELRAELREAADALASERASTSARVSLAERVEALGFGIETVEVFDLLPLVHIAWADGEVQAPEREAILHVLEARDIVVGSPGYLLIASLLEQHPGETYMSETLAILREILGRSSKRATALVELCCRVAEAHGAGPHGLDDPIDPRERQALGEVVEALGERWQTWLDERLAP